MDINEIIYCTKIGKKENSCNEVYFDLILVCN